MSDLGAPAGPLALALQRGVEEAARGARDMAKEARLPLTNQCCTISACRRDFAEAHHADAEFKRYSDKVRILESPRHGDVSTKERARLGRNQEKLRQAEKAASTSRTRAGDSMEACAARRKDLCELGAQILGRSAQAFRCVAQTAELELEKGDNASSSWSSPEAQAMPGAWQLSLSPREDADALNPFADDARAEALGGLEQGEDDKPADTCGTNPFGAESSTAGTDREASEEVDSLEAVSEATDKARPPPRSPELMARWPGDDRAAPAPAPATATFAWLAAGGAAAPPMSEDMLRAQFGIPTIWQASAFSSRSGCAGRA